jgi:lauroyl-KDO2-lipid IV(A) myristoyltransferase
MSKQTDKKRGAVVQEGDRKLQSKHFHPRYWITWLGIATMSMLWLIPRRLRDKIFDLISQLYLKKNSNHRHYARVNLALCFPELSKEQRYDLLKKHYRSFFQVMSDAPLFWWGSDAMIKKRVNITGKSEADKAIKSGKSVIFLVCHSSALDVSITTLSIFYKMQGFYKPFKNPVFDWFMFYTRSKRGGRLAARGEGFKTVIRDLKRGLTLLYLSDEDLGREGSVFVPFFNQPKATLAMLPRIVKITNAIVFPVYTHYCPQKGQYQISILPAMKDYPSGDELEDVRKMNEATEQSIMISPEQYLWKLRLFKTQANPEEKSPYNKVKSGELDLDL